MALNDAELGVLKDIQNYSRIERYLGMLPAKLTVVYQDGLLQNLIDLGLVEEGVILTSCGANPSGFRLTDEGRQTLFESGCRSPKDRWERLAASQHPDVDALDADTLDVLVDLYHLSKLRRFGGVVPVDFLEGYSRASFSALYDLGLIYWVKLKGKDVQRSKGYILSDKAVRLLRMAGEIDSCGCPD